MIASVKKGSVNINSPATAVRDPTAEETPAALRDTAREAAGAIERPRLSVIIPVRNDPVNLELCLRALEASEHPADEVIVIDDASTDATAEVARAHGVQLLRQETRSGPAAARNRGARVAQNPYLFFLDADVCVEPRTLGQVAAKFDSDPAVDAFFGSYDTRPGAPNFVSQYRNLLHHFVHQAGRQRAFTFWSGCGAIKRSVFLDLGGFDTGYANASIEDIELGSRLRRAEHRVELVKEVQVKHMKRWTLARMIRTDVRSRALPWTRLILRQGKIPNDLNLRHSQRLSALFAAGLVATLAVGSWYDPGMLFVPLGLFLGLMAIDRWTTRRPLPRWARIAGGVATFAAVAALLAYVAASGYLIPPWTLLALAFLFGIVLLNLGFYRFLWRVKHPLFVLLVVPLHVLYYLYSSLAFAAGLILHLGHGRRRQPEPR